MNETLLSQIERKIVDYGEAKVVAPSEHIAHLWADGLTGYVTDVRHTEVDDVLEWVIFVSSPFKESPTDRKFPESPPPNPPPPPRKRGTEDRGPR